MTMLATPVWIQKPKPDAKVRILCFPFAGSGAGAFRDWSLGDHIEVASVQLPGREWRRNEKTLTRMSDLVDDLLPAVSDWLDESKTSAFFGYSMGAIVSYALIIRLQQAGKRIPNALLVAASQAPQLMGKRESIYQLSDDEFMLKIKQLGGMPAAITAEPELLKLALPALKADFEALHTYTQSPFEPINCPIIAYGGSEDQHAPKDGVVGWRKLTNADFNMRLFSGGHFFINTAREQLLQTMKMDLNMLI